MNSIPNNTHIIVLKKMYPNNPFQVLLSPKILFLSRKFLFPSIGFFRKSNALTLLQKIELIIPAIIVIILAFIAIGPLASSIMSNNMAQVAITSGNATMFIQQIPAETLSTSLASMGIVVIIAIILAIIFGIFAIIGLCRLAKSESIGDALSFGKVWEDIRNIGILKIIGYLILLWILLFLISIVIGIISIIPFVGAIIAALILYPYMTFLMYRSLGLLYSDA